MGHEVTFRTPFHALFLFRRRNALFGTCPDLPRFFGRGLVGVQGHLDGDGISLRKNEFLQSDMYLLHRVFL